MSLSKPLDNPVRIASIICYREMRNSRALPSRHVANPELSAQFITDLDLQSVRKNLKEIYLSDMHKDKSFSEHFIELTVIEDPYPDYSVVDMGMAFYFLVEDKQGEVLTLQVLNYLAEDRNERFAVGMQILLLRPLRNSTMLQVDGKKLEETVIPLGKRNDMCRCCGEQNTTKRCVNCKVPYCGRECQQADWKILKHKLVCIEEGVSMPTAEEVRARKSKGRLEGQAETGASMKTPGEDEYILMTVDEITAMVNSICAQTKQKKAEKEALNP